MSKKTSITLILIIFFIALGSLLWFYFSLNPLNTRQINQTSSIPIDTYNPFGNTINNDIIVGTSTTDITNIIVDKSPEPINKLRLISNEPISGFSVINNIKDKTINIYYSLRANSHIYETYIDSIETKRLSITTVPKVYESIWFPDGTKLILRYLSENNENIQSFSVKIKSATSTINEFEGKIEGNHLPENISNLVINPNGDKIFYLLREKEGSSGFISKSDGLNKKLIYESPLIEWLLSWPKESIITLNTKPSYNIPGYMYFLDSQTGNITRIIGDIKGLTTKTNKEGTLVLYSDSTNKVPRLYLFDIKTGENKALPFNTLPEKCVWSNNNNEIIYCAVPKSLSIGEYPDIWYQGLINFTDDIWMFNTSTEASTLVFDIKNQTNNNIDIIEPQIINDEYLFFINKIDLTFWNLNLKS